MKLDESIKIAIQVKRLHRLYRLSAFTGEIECPLCEGDSSFYDPNREHISERSFDCKMCGGKGTISKQKYEEWMSQFPKKEKKEHRLSLVAYMEKELDKFVALIPDAIKEKLPNHSIKLMYGELRSLPKHLADYIAQIDHQIKYMTYPDVNKDYYTCELAKETQQYKPYKEQYKKCYEIAKIFNSSTYEDSMNATAVKYDLASEISDLHKYTEKAIKNDDY